MTLSLDYIRKKIGWCPHAKTLHTSPPVISTPPVTINPAQPDGGAGGSGRIGRGVTLALGSIRILLRNRWLLWFSLLTGLVMIFSLASSLYLQFISGTPLFPGTNFPAGPASVLIAKGSLPWIVLTFTIGLVSTILSYYLLAALITCVSRILSDRDTSIHDGLTHAGSCLRPLFGWAVIGALIGTVFSFIMNPPTTASGSIGNFGIIFIAMAVLAVFNILTLFVVPLLVLGNESLVNAFMGSLSLFRKVWGEMLVCFIIFFLIGFAVLFTSLIPMIAIGFSTATAGAIVVAYMLVMIVLLFIGSTVLGIAIVGLYTYGKTRTLSAMFDGKQDGFKYS
ncbi:MAG: DUF6159 family protein [Methanoregula sp.]|nr:DUF6159 family protein [Methanoregula sp.]